MPARWVTAWGTSQQGLGTASISNATVRVIARVTIPGSAVRARIDNTYGKDPLIIRKAYVGSRKMGAAIVPGSNRQMLFDGGAAVTIPPGASRVSDPVSLSAVAHQDLAVSLYIPQSDVRPSQHGNSNVTSYLSANDAGDIAAEEAGTPFTKTTTDGFWLKSIDVQSTTAAGAIVTFGDSITQGFCGTPDAYNRWPDWLALRLAVNGRMIAVVNEAIDGNTALAKHPDPIPPAGTAAVDRLERDVLSHEGVTHVVLFIGTNDLRRHATSVQVSAGLQDIITRVKARGIKIFGSTIVPRHNSPRIPWDASMGEQRHQLNDWIRSKAPFDAVIDFDKVMRDPANVDMLVPTMDCDGIHPNALGYYEMGMSVNLGLFGGAAKAR